MLCDAIWIRTVFIMNIHEGVAMRSGVAKLRDGISCLREVGSILGKRPLSVFNLGHTHLCELCIRQLSTAIAPMPYTVLS